MRALPVATRQMSFLAAPPEAKRLSSLSRIDYDDAFLIDVGSPTTRSAEGWAHLIFDEAPAAQRESLYRAWSALGLRLGPRQRDGFVLGWRVRRSVADHVVLGADSPLGLSAELLVKRERDRLLFCTFVYKRNLLGRMIWAAVDALHRPTVWTVMERASMRARKDGQRP